MIPSSSSTHPGHSNSGIISPRMTSMSNSNSPSFASGSANSNHSGSSSNPTGSIAASGNNIPSSSISNSAFSSIPLSSTAPSTSSFSPFLTSGNPTISTTPYNPPSNTSLHLPASYSPFLHQQDFSPKTLHSTGSHLPSVQLSVHHPSDGSSENLSLLGSNLSDESTPLLGGFAGRQATGQIAGKGRGPTSEDLSPLLNSVPPSHSSGISGNSFLQSMAVYAASIVPGVGSSGSVETLEVTVDEDRGSARSKTANKRFSSTATAKSDKFDKCETSTNSKKKSKHTSSNFEEWQFRENLLWLWQGSPLSGLLCMAASAVCYSVMGLLVKLLSARAIPSFETVMIRCAVISLLSFLHLNRISHPLFGHPSLHLSQLLLARAVVGFIALSAFFYSIQILPLQDATVLNFTAPIFTAVFAAIFMEESFGTREILASLTGLLGVLLVVQPPFIFGDFNNSVSTLTSIALSLNGTDPSGVATNGGNISLAVLGMPGADLSTSLLPTPALAVPPAREESLFAVLISLVSAAMAAVSFCIVRTIGKTGEQPMVVVFAFAAFSTPAALVCLLLFQEFVAPGFLELVGMVLVGLTAFAAQVFLTRALQLEKAGKATSIQYVKVVCTFILGILFLNEIPTVLGVLGALVICLSVNFVSTAKDEKDSLALLRDNTSLRI